MKRDQHRSDVENECDRDKIVDWLIEVLSWRNGVLFFSSSIDDSIELATNAPDFFRHFEISRRFVQRSCIIDCITLKSASIDSCAVVIDGFILFTATSCEIDHWSIDSADRFNVSYVVDRVLSFLTKRFFTQTTHSMLSFKTLQFHISMTCRPFLDHAIHVVSKAIHRCHCFYRTNPDVCVLVCHFFSSKVNKVVGKQIII
jgi:hypothetical protein